MELPITTTKKRTKRPRKSKKRKMMSSLFKLSPLLKILIQTCSMSILADRRAIILTLRLRLIINSKAIWRLLWLRRASKIKQLVQMLKALLRNLWKLRREMILLSHLKKHQLLKHQNLFPKLKKFKHLLQVMKKKQQLLQMLQTKKLQLLKMNLKSSWVQSKHQKRPRRPNLINRIRLIRRLKKSWQSERQCLKNLMTNLKRKKQLQRQFQLAKNLRKLNNPNNKLLHQSESLMPFRKWNQTAKLKDLLFQENQPTKNQSQQPPFQISPMKLSPMVKLKVSIPIPWSKV